VKKTSHLRPSSSRKGPAIPTWGSPFPPSIHWIAGLALGLLFSALGTSRAVAQEHDHRSAGEAVTLELTLDKVETMALSRNPHILAAGQRAEAAGKRVLPSLFPSDPMFMIEKNGMTGGPFNFSSGMETWMLEQSMPFPGMTIAEADVQGAEAARLRAEEKDARRRILKDIRQAFWDFYARRKVWEVRKEAEKRWAVLSQTVKSRELTGQWLSLKTLRMQLEVAKATNMFITSGRELRISTAMLNHTLSLPTGTEYRLEEDPPIPAFAFDRKVLRERALRGNPRLEAMRREADKMNAMKNVDLISHLPELNFRLMGMRDPMGSGFSEYGFRFGLSIPVFFPAKQTQRSDAAGAEVQAAQFDLKGMEDETVHMLEEAYVAAESAWRILALYEEGGLRRQTEKAWQSAQVAYRNEQMPLPDYVESYNIYLETLAQYFGARAEYGKALANLEYELGVGDVERKKP
jgi:outer membrane protein TolC